MDLNLGSIFNSIANIGTKLSDSGQSGDSLKTFLHTMTDYGIQVKSNFEVTYSGFTGLQFFIQNITTPGLKTNNGQIYFKGRVVNIPINYEQEHEFQMTVINDASGFVYTQLRNILMNDYGNRKPENNYKMTVSTVGDRQYSNGMTIEMTGIRFTGISQLDFGSTDGTVQTFTVNCITTQMNFKYTDTEATEQGGILGSINKIGSTINNILGG